MAKWGEGDPRWIVEEREDGTNADNWHWTEKKATAWSEKTLRDLLPNLAVDGPGGKCRITEVDSVDGDVIANCRKGKLIFFYEVVIKVKWTGETDDGTIVNGTAEVPNLSEEQDIEDLEFKVKLTSDETPERRKVKDLMRKKGGDLVRTQLAKWLKMLKEEYATDLVKPSKKGQPPTVNGGKAGVPVPVKAATPTAASTHKTVPKAAAPATKYRDFTLTDEFKCSAMDLFSAICTQEKVQAYTQSECKIDPKVGGEFSMFGGNVQGVFEKVEPGKLIQQAWRFKHWPAGHFSTVVLEITETDDKCKLKLTQKGVPEADLESTKGGWKNHQWDRMKAILGFGSGLSIF